MREWTRWTIAAALFAAVGAGSAQQREMNVRQGPETVFMKPPAEVVPLLAGALPTGENGRVGLELVFWGFKQPSGRSVFLFGCAPSEEVDCEERVALICPTVGSTEVLEQRMDDGTIVRRNCRNLAVAAPGDTRPGCEDRPATAGLLVGVVSCN